MKWYCQSEVLKARHVRVTFCSPQIPLHGSLHTRQTGD